MEKDDFQTRMIKYTAYNFSIKTKEAEGKTYYLIGVTFKPSWTVIEPTKESGVFCMPSTEGNGRYYYFAELQNGVNGIFEAIDETIRYNEDIEKKVELLQKKVVELRDLFAVRSYEELTKLQFTFVTEEPQKTKAKKGGRKKKTVVSKEEEKVPETEKGVEERKTEETPVVQEQQGKNIEEANAIDAKIAAAMGKNKA